MKRELFRVTPGVDGETHYYLVETYYYLEFYYQYYYVMANIMFKLIIMR